jgi:hypothetical protein
VTYLCWVVVQYDLSGKISVSSRDRNLLSCNLLYAKVKL